jgi:hypothetical protein
MEPRTSTTQFQPTGTTNQKALLIPYKFNKFLDDLNCVIEFPTCVPRSARDVHISIAREQPPTLLEFCKRTVINLIFAKWYTDEQVEKIIFKLGAIWPIDEINHEWNRFALCSPVVGCSWLYPPSYFDCLLLNSPVNNRIGKLVYYQGLCAMCNGKKGCLPIGSIKQHHDITQLEGYFKPDNMPEDFDQAEEMNSEEDKSDSVPNSPLPLPDQSAFPKYPGGCGHKLLSIRVDPHDLKRLTDHQHLWEDHLTRSQKKTRRFLDHSEQDIPVMSPLQ